MSAARGGIALPRQAPVASTRPGLAFDRHRAVLHCMNEKTPP
jgi:hypothetical protein